MSLGTKIYELRKEANWSQEELADRLGVSRQTVSKWELDQSVPELDKVQKICTVFGLSLDSLVYDIKKEVEDNSNSTNKNKHTYRYLRICLLLFLAMIVSIPIMSELKVSNNIMSAIVTLILLFSLYYLVKYIISTRK